MTQSVVKVAIFTEILVDRGKNSYFHFKKKPVKNGAKWSAGVTNSTTGHRQTTQAVHGNASMSSPAALKFWELTLLACFADSLLGQNGKNTNQRIQSGQAFSNKC